MVAVIRYYACRRQDDSEITHPINQRAHMDLAAEANRRHTKYAP